MTNLYTNDKTHAIDQLAAEYLGVSSFELMQLAGAAVYQHVKDLGKLLVITGPGNNGGDGFVIAELARQQGQVVKVLALHDVTELSGDAQLAAEQYRGEVISPRDFDWQKQLDCDAVVDAVFGTGLNKPVDQPYKDQINSINQWQLPIIAVDIPSGLNGSSGQIEGVAIKANRTTSILVHNTGLFTADGKDCCGEIKLESLGVPDAVYQGLKPDGQLLNASILSKIHENRQNNSHKGQFGHVITAGGQTGMLGAVLLAGKAVLKSGAGSTTVLTDTSHAHSVPLYAPEIMSCGFDADKGDADLLDLMDQKAADVLLLGMGLGQTSWSKALFKSCLYSELPMVIDADGLSLLSRAPKVPAQLKVITPHPKEAAVLLKTTVNSIQQNRWQAVKKLAEKYSCVAVLKGSGTLIADGNQVWCCPYGNANLATAGSGDVLAGMIAGLMAQGFEATLAAQVAVIWHGVVGERSRFGLSLTASDLLNSLHEVWSEPESRMSFKIWNGI